MNTPAQQIAADMATLVALNPLTAVIGGQSVVGARAAVRRSVRYMAAGALAGYAFSWRCTAAALTAAGLSTPAVDSTLTIGGTTYRVLEVTTDAVGASVILDLGAQYA